MVVPCDNAKPFELTAYPARAYGHTSYITSHRGET